MLKREKWGGDKKRRGEKNEKPLAWEKSAKPLLVLSALPTTPSPKLLITLSLSHISIFKLHLLWTRRLRLPIYTQRFQTLNAKISNYTQRPSLTLSKPGRHTSIVISARSTAFPRHFFPCSLFTNNITKYTGLWPNRKQVNLLKRALWEFSRATLWNFSSCLHCVSEISG